LNINRNKLVKKESVIQIKKKTWGCGEIIRISNHQIITSSHHQIIYFALPTGAGGLSKKNDPGMKLNHLWIIK